MSEAEKTIKVVDRRLFTADGEVREEIQKELDSVPSTPAPAPEAPPPTEEPAEEKIATSQPFLRLLDMLAQTAGMYLEGFPDPATGRRQVDLAGAKQIVDSILALREKTRGRLSFEETDAIEGLLGELQLAFARLTGAIKPKGPAAPAPRRG